MTGGMTQLRVILGLVLLCAAAPAESAVVWESKDGIEQFRINTERLSGVFVARDTRDLKRGFARHGLRQLVFKPIGPDLHAPEGKVGAKRRHQGHLNLYRVYAGNETFGSLRDDLAELKRLKDGAQLNWPASDKRPVEVTASWRLSGPAQIDLHLKATPKRDLKNFEILPASYCPVNMVKHVYLSRDGKPTPVAVKTPTDPATAKLYPFYPLTAADRAPQEATGRIHSTWKWPTTVAKENAALPIVFASDHHTEIILMGDPASTSAVCATPRPGSGQPEDWNSVGQHSALYLSFFCRDVKAGETVTARARLVFREPSAVQSAPHIRHYREFVAETGGNRN